MTMSVTVTASPEEISNISTALDAVNFISSISKETDIYFVDKKITPDDLLKTKNYLSSLLSILNTRGMSIHDYEESLKYT
jgi:hypothetical protein